MSVFAVPVTDWRTAPHDREFVAQRRAVLHDSMEQGLDFPIVCDHCGHVVVAADVVHNAGRRTEYFMLADDIWDEVDHNGVLCVSCTETRLGRVLGADDFDNPDDHLLRWGLRPSIRLAKRRA